MTTGEATPGVEDGTYRELVDAAFSAIGKASFAMMTARFIDETDAAAAVAAYRDLLDAVRTHVEYLIPSTRQPVPVVAATAVTLDDLTAPLGASIVLLAERARRSIAPGNPATLPPAARLWRVAAAKLRAAHDLLDTHRDPDHGWRTPDAWLLDSTRPQAAAVDSLAGFLRTVANSGQALALRAREADRDINCVDLLNPAPLRIAAASLSHHARARGPIDALDELTPAREPARGPRAAADSFGKAVQTMTALRQQAWEQARARHVSIRTIAHYALLAITVHQHAAAIASAAAHRRPQIDANDPAAAFARRLQRSSQLSSAAVAAWRDVYRLGAGLQAATPTDAATYEQVLEVRSALESLTRNGDGWRRVAEMLPDDKTERRVLADTQQIVRPLEEITAWQTAAITRLASGGALFVASTSLDRDDVSEDPTLAAARLDRRLVALPQRQTQQLLRAFVAADHATWVAVKAHASTTAPTGIASRPRLLAMRALHRAAGQPSIGL
jgi:hypothetical protein